MAQEFYHNWMYSFIPGSIPVWTQDSYSPGQDVFLCGYCKNCNKAFTVRLNMDASTGFTSLTQTDIPKTGCVGTPAAPIGFNPAAVTASF